MKKIIAFIIVALAIVYIAGDIIITHTVHYSSGKIVDINIEEEYVEVKCDKYGRIFISDINDFEYSDFNYGDVVELEIINQHYSITDILEEGE